MRQKKGKQALLEAHAVELVRVFGESRTHTHTNATRGTPCGFDSFIDFLAFVRLTRRHCQSVGVFTLAFTAGWVLLQRQDGRCTCYE